MPAAITPAPTIASTMLNPACFRFLLNLFNFDLASLHKNAA
jgi:hypothetical protein